MIGNDWPARDTHHRRGYLYVLRFSNNVVKVGHTESPRERIAAHRADAGRYGLTIDDAWLSAGHSNHAETERTLLATLPQLGRMLSAEYTLASYRAVVAAAVALDLHPPSALLPPSRFEQQRQQRNERIRTRYAELRSVRGVADELGVSKSLVARVVVS